MCWTLWSGLGALSVDAQSPKVWTGGRALPARNIGTRQQQNQQFPPHQIRLLGIFYDVGTESLGSFLVVTPEGLILINSDSEQTVPVIRISAEALGFLFGAIKILLGSHAHADHMRGDALVKELTVARVMAIEQDVPALRAMTPGNKSHPIDRILHDGEQVTPAAQPSSPG